MCWKGDYVITFVVVFITVFNGALSEGVVVTEEKENGGPSFTVILAPSEDPLRLGAGETLTLTCTVLPVASVQNASVHDHAITLKKLLEQDKKRKDLNNESINKLSLLDEEENPVPQLHWIVPINAPERVKEERLKSSVSGVVSIRVSVQQLQETDSGNYTCEVPQYQHSATARVIVEHRDVVQHCGLSSFQCSTGECIPTRFVCDAKPDCPKGTDELPSYCGPTVCEGKLQCDNGRCLDPRSCCRPLQSGDVHPSNCSINPAIRCCKQLMHPAVLNQDLYYLATRPKPHQSERPHFSHRSSPLLIGSLVAFANIATVCLVLALRPRLWYSHHHPDGHPPGTRGNNSSHSWWGAHSPHYCHRNPIRAWLCRRRCTPYSRPPPPSDIITLSTLRGDDVTLRFCPPPFRSTVGMIASTPPPSYQQATRGSPPPYSEVMTQGDASTSSVPLLSHPSTSSHASINNQRNPLQQLRVTTSGRPSSAPRLWRGSPGAPPPPSTAAATTNTSPETVAPLHIKHVSNITGLMSTQHKPLPSLHQPCSHSAPEAASASAVQSASGSDASVVADARQLPTATIHTASYRRRPPPLTTVTLKPELVSTSRSYSFSSVSTSSSSSCIARSSESLASSSSSSESQE